MTLIHLQALSRIFQSGNQQHLALDAVSLTVRRGEMVAITGPSGSGKSTLLNILGCLDSADSGTYHLAGTDVSQLNHNQLASLRRQHLGFIFQRYYLLDDLNVAANIALPTVYAGQHRQKSLQKAGELLHHLGLDDRLHARPSTLSGGQQQRVCIARALINDADIILADEPTGALDEHSAREVMAVLRRLHAQGHTVIIVTHDRDIARQAGRLIEMKAGRIVADTPLSGSADSVPSASEVAAKHLQVISLRQSLAGALTMAIASLRARKLRTLLTLSGVVLGIAAVSTVVAIGNGAKQSTLESISRLGTSVVTLYDEHNTGTTPDIKSPGLTPQDARALETRPWSHSVSPEVSLSQPVSFRAKQIKVMAKGVSPQWFTIQGYRLTEGRLFQDAPEPEVVISQGLQDILNHRINIGDILLAGDTPLRVTGIVREKIAGGQRYPEMWVPWQTAVQRMTGRNKADSIVLRLREGFTGQGTLDSISRFITLRHGVTDFSLFNADSIRRSAEQASLTLRLLILMIGLIALLTGMVGVMNIMLVSVSERTHEIGVRMATGARRTDILHQFLLESVLICLCGGVIGILFSLAINLVLVALGNGRLLPLYSWEATGGAFLCALLTGLMAGYLPARKAARMDPVTALAGL